MRRILTGLAAALGLALVANAADATPRDQAGPAQPNGADPCATGQAVGNHCDGNNGNDKGVGNAGQKEEVDLGWCANAGSGACVQGAGAGEAPEGAGPRGAYISQVGNANRAGVDQSRAAASAHATIAQSGDRNLASLRQSGQGGDFADVRQSGHDNAFVAEQAGPTRNSLLAGQLGMGNHAAVVQGSGGGVNAALIYQEGVGQDVTLIQNGADNDAVLTQRGSGNAMTLSQQGTGNKAAWTQDGDNLPNLNVSQSGSMALTIVQSNAP
ncbi:MAG TPA: hypothetical protein VIO94_06975 [Phenylobacterium sp.]